MEIAIKENLKIIIARQNLQGKDLIDVRKWYWDSDNVQWAPTKKGISLNATHEEVQQVSEGLAEIAEQLKNEKEQEDDNNGQDM